MKAIVLNTLLVLVLICISGVFVAAEMALVSLRESQVRQLAHRSKRGQTVGRLTSNPNRFLSAVQLGVTLSGFLSAAFGGATLAVHLAPHLETLGLSSGVADTVALILITIGISYVSIVVGELTAKRLALQRSEAFATGLAPFVEFIARIARPVVWLLGVSTNVLVRLLGGDPGASREEVTDEEIRALVSESQTLGAEERQIVDDVFDAGRRSLREVMIPRTEVDFLPGSTPAYKAAAQVLQAPHSRYPVMGESADDILGFVHVRDLLDPEVSHRSTPVSELARPVIMLPDTVRVLRALSEMRREAAHLAIVLDEYGGTAGIVTMEDVVEELVGEITDEYDEVPADQPSLAGEQEFDGLLTLDEFFDRTRYRLAEGHYDTLAGFFVAGLGQVPTLGESIVAGAELEDERAGGDDEAHVVRLELTVVELDGRRASRLMVRAAPPTSSPESEEFDRAEADPQLEPTPHDRSAGPVEVEPLPDGTGPVVTASTAAAAAVKAAAREGASSPPRPRN